MNPASSTSPRPSVSRIVALTALLIAMTGNGWAQDNSPHAVARMRLASVSVVDLERSFWVCDYVAAARGVTEDLIIHCAATYDELKDRKFGGDFDRLLGWWQQNKAASHARLGAELALE
ncbi:MAG: hypothetical protein ACXWVT_02880 [Burkholderiaceae bacterium]